MIMKTALITGANKGIGYETAKQLAKLGYYVYLGCREASLGQEAVDKLVESGLTNVESIQLDVTDPITIKESCKAIENKSNQLDVLINNAGILGLIPQPASTYSVEEIRKVFDTNCFGTIRVTQAFIPLLRKSDSGRIVNVTSGLGSLTLHTDPNWQYFHFKSAGYSISKAALNGFTIMLAFDLKDTDIKVNSIDPNYTATDFNNHRGERTPEQSAKVIVKYATLDNNGPTGKYFNEEGELPW